MTTTPDKPIPVKSTKPPADTERWNEFMLAQQQKTPDRIEDAAKFVATMISTSLTLFLAIVGGNQAIPAHPEFPIIKAAVIGMFVALILAFLTLYPYRYKYVKDSVEEVKKLHGKIIKRKYTLLTLSVVLFITSLSMLVCLFL